MKLYRKIIAKFAKWLQAKHKTVHLDELPDNIKSKTIYIIGDSEQPWLLAFNCPCGCQTLIHLNLLKEAKPCWKFHYTPQNKINISPSVWRTNGCKSHFFVHDGKIDWVRSYKPHKNPIFEIFSRPRG